MVHMYFQRSSNSVVHDEYYETWDYDALTSSGCDI